MSKHGAIKPHRPGGWMLHTLFTVGQAADELGRQQQLVRQVIAKLGLKPFARVGAFDWYHPDAGRAIRDEFARRDAKHGRTKLLNAWPTLTDDQRARILAIAAE